MPPGLQCRGHLSRGSTILVVVKSWFRDESVTGDRNGQTPLSRGCRLLLTAWMPLSRNVQALLYHWKPDTIVLFLE